MKKFFIFLSLGVLSLTACKDDKQQSTSEDTTDVTEEKSEEIRFTTIALEAKQSDACKAKPQQECPRVQVSYLKAEPNTPANQRMNQLNEKQLITILNSNSDTPNAATDLQEAVTIFIEDYFSFKEEFPDSPGAYQAEISQSPLYQNDSLVVIETNFYVFTGGAHGYGATRFKQYNPNNGEQIEQADLFSDEKAFTAYVESAFRKKYDIPEGENINSTGFFFEEDTFALPNNIGVTKDSIQLIYNRYEAASYAQGELELMFPKTEV